jgi:hypothetical protein
MGAKLESAGYLLEDDSAVFIVFVDHAEQLANPFPVDAQDTSKTPHGNGSWRHEDETLQPGDQHLFGNRLRLLGWMQLKIRFFHRNVICPVVVIHISPVFE